MRPMIIVLDSVQDYVRSVYYRRVPDKPWMAVNPDAPQ